MKWLAAFLIKKSLMPIVLGCVATCPKSRHQLRLDCHACLQMYLPTFPSVECSRELIGSPLVKTHISSKIRGLSVPGARVVEGSSGSPLHFSCSGWPHSSPVFLLVRHTQMTSLLSRVSECRVGIPFGQRATAAPAARAASTCCQRAFCGAERRSDVSQQGRGAFPGDRGADL